MDQTPQSGTIREINGKAKIYSNGCWVRYYAVPEESLREKKKHIERLTRRAFHHTEPGINTPGGCLELARRAYKDETEPARKRVNAAMLAGALFNRATDIFTSIVDLEQKGVKICQNNELMIQCGECFKEALELGRQVKHFSGQEGVDELWGEPMKAFAISLKDFYDSRYIKIAAAMHDIDSISEELKRIAHTFGFDEIRVTISEYAAVCKQVCETAKSDPDIFTIWPHYVATHEEIKLYCQRCSSAPDITRRLLIDDAFRLLGKGSELISYMAGTRVPMPKSIRDFFDESEAMHHRMKMVAGSSE